MSSGDSSDVTLCKGRYKFKRVNDHDLQSSLVKSFLQFRKRESLTQAFLLQESVILSDPPEVASQPKSADRRGAEGR